MRGLAPSNSSHLPSGDQRGHPTSAPRPRKLTLVAGASAAPSARRQPHVVGLILMRVERDPAAVGRPAERLILGRRRMDDARGGRGRVLRIDRDDAGVLRDVGIPRVVHETAPRAVGDPEPRAGRVPRRRLALEERERLARTAAGRRHRDLGVVTLDLEQHRAVGGDARRVGVARERRQAARGSAGDRRRPQIDHAGRIGHRDIHRRAVRRERDRPVGIEIGIRLDRRAAARDRHARATVDRDDAGDLAARRPGGKGDAARDPPGGGGRSVRRDGPELLPVAGVDDRRDRSAVGRPGRLRRSATRGRARGAGGRAWP